MLREVPSTLSAKAWIFSVFNPTAFHITILSVVARAEFNVWTDSQTFWVAFRVRPYAPSSSINGSNTSGDLRIISRKRQRLGQPARGEISRACNAGISLISNIREAEGNVDSKLLGPHAARCLDLSCIRFVVCMQKIFHAESSYALLQESFPWIRSDFKWW